MTHSTTRRAPSGGIFPLHGAAHKKDAWFTICCSMRHVKIFLKLLSRKNVRFFDFYEDK